MTTTRSRIRSKPRPEVIDVDKLDVKEKRKYYDPKEFMKNMKEYNKLGWITHPLKHFKKDGSRCGKSPIHKKWNTNTESTPFSNKFSTCNIGVQTGKRSGITVVDIDTHCGAGELKGIDVWSKLSDTVDEPITLVSKTGSGGYHFIFNYIPGIKTGEKMIICDGMKATIDVRNDHYGQIVLPPSIHKNNNPYTWYSEDDINDMPDWLESLLTGKTEIHSDKDGDYEFIESIQPEIKDRATYDSPDTDFVIAVVELLNNTRSDDFGTWKKVVMALSNEGPQYRELAHTFSKRTNEKYDETVVDNLFDGNHSINTTPITFGTIRMWAKEDNPEEYKRVVNYYMIREDSNMLTLLSNHFSED